eukprot:gnl/Chilomastix_cuspidata/7919.p3 GENE.gnl/Chilomastix_cuspidata/7919~~gnl/Chilomastix_cuspidata/7919.p3  ORF type:complete len:204 (-),score=118.33 gnl/Chilomastix_cuspidata/7919:15-626(-)
MPRFTLHLVSALSEVLVVSTELRRLSLYGFGLTRSDAASLSFALAHNKGLRTLVLCSCGIDARGARALLRALAAHASLRHLLLPDNRISDDAADAVRKLIEAQSGRRLSDMWRHSLRTTLPESFLARRTEGLVLLDLSYNPVANGTAAALFAALREDRFLTHVNLEGTLISERDDERADGASPRSSESDALGIRDESPRGDEI